MLPIVFVGPIAGVFVDRWPLKPTLVSSDLIRAGLALLLIPATVGLAGVPRARGAQLRVGVLRAGADGDDPLARADARADVRERADADRLHGQPHRRAGDRRRHGRALHARTSATRSTSSASWCRRPDRARSRSGVRRRSPAPSESSSNRIHAIWLDMVAGMRFIVHHAAILFFVLAMAAGLFTIGCFGPLISLYVRDTLHASAGLFGYVSGMVGVGLLVGTQVVRIIARKASDTGLVLWGLVGHRRRRAAARRRAAHRGDAGRDLHDRLRVRGDHGAGADADSARDAARHARPRRRAPTRRSSSSARSSAWRCPASSPRSSACARCSSSARRCRSRSPGRAGFLRSNPQPTANASAALPSKTAIAQRAPQSSGAASNRPDPAIAIGVLRVRVFSGCCEGTMNGLIQDLRYAVRAFAPEPGLHRRGAALARDRRRRELGHLQRRQRAAAAAAAVPGCRAAGDPLEPIAGSRHRGRLVLDRAVLRHQARASAASSRSRSRSAATTT